MKKEYIYTNVLKWAGKINEDSIQNDRLYTVSIEGKPDIEGSADKCFHGDESMYNPEDMLMAALASCHMMSFFYVCRKKGYKVVSYQDEPKGMLSLEKDGSGKFEKVTLYPKVELEKSIGEELLLQLHQEASKLCFIANSCDFEIEYHPIY